MYRDELAAAHAENQILKRRIAELEATATADPSESLLELMQRGRKARAVRAKRDARARAEAAERARRQAAREKLAVSRSRAARRLKACRRINLLKHAHVAPLAGVMVLMCLLPVVIFSSLGRWIILPLSSAALAWPLVAWATNRIINRDCVAAEGRWLGGLRFPLANHFETLSDHLDRSITFVVRHRGQAPSAEIVADLVAGIADGSRGLAREMLERTTVRSQGDHLWLTARFVDSDAGRNREYRIWSHAVAGVLDELAEHFPVAAAEITASSS